jgi:hypothetical protein
MSFLCPVSDLQLYQCILGNSQKGFYRKEELRQADILQSIPYYRAHTRVDKQIVFHCHLRSAGIK